jgi:hypothetical protein
VELSDARCSETKAKAADRKLRKQKKETIMTLTRKNLLQTAIGVVVLSAASTTINAQCVSGLGASSNQLGTQNWGGAPAMDFTTYINPLGLNGGLTPLPKFTSLGSDGGRVYAINGTSVSQLVVSLSLVGIPTLAYSELPYLSSRLLKIIAGGNGSVWVNTADGNIINIDAFQNGYPAGVQVGAAVGAAFDGMNIWFSTSTGKLQKVQAPYATSAGTFADSINFGSSPLGPVAFDGQYIWVGSGSNIIQFDPTTNKTVSTVPTGGPIASILFDGVYLWIGDGEKAALIKYDPVAHQVINDITPGGSGFDSIIFDGKNVLAFSSGATAPVGLRACDARAVNPYILPGRPAQAVFDGYRTWITYAGSNMVSIR